MNTVFYFSGSLGNGLVFGEKNEISFCVSEKRIIVKKCADQLSITLPEKEL